VLTLPVDFDLIARRELELAARMAGIEIAALVLEPVAAAMGCGHDGMQDEVISVFDFGGGTLDVSVIEVGQGRFTVRGAAGDRRLGGDDFDEVLARYVADEFFDESGISLHGRAEEWQRLVFDCEEAKRWLSSLESVDVILPNAAQSEDGPVTLMVPVDRETFEEVSQDILTSSLEVCRNALSEAGTDPTAVTELLVTGGTTRIPVVRNAAQRFFGREPAAGIHPEHAVVIGAAVHAAVLSGTPIPPDFADRLRGQGTIGHTIGLALAGGETEHLITANDRPPIAAHRSYSTARDDQTFLRIELVEGTSQVTGQNRRIGGFVIDGLPALPAGEVSLDVYFELASTGTLSVTAVERGTGRRAQRSFDLNEI
jgi:molecular chaperone DnaK